MLLILWSQISVSFILTVANFNKYIGLKGNFLLIRLHKLYFQHYTFFERCELKRKSLLIVIISDMYCGILQPLKCYINYIDMQNNYVLLWFIHGHWSFSCIVYSIFYKYSLKPGRGRHKSLKHVVTLTCNGRQHVQVSRINS